MFRRPCRRKVDQITELHKGGESHNAMAEPNAAARGENRAVPQMDGVVPHMDGAGVEAAVQAAAPVAAVADMAEALFRRFAIEAVLLGPLPTKSNLSCKILPKISDETWP